MEESRAMELEIFVEPGKVTENFEAFKEMVRVELETKYKNIDVSEESLKDAKAARARLNKAKESLKESMRSAQRQNDEPLKVPKAQAKELETLLDEAILVLDEQIKAIENKRKDDKFAKAMDIYREVFGKQTEDVRSLADKCKWICRAEWSNLTYSASKVKEDCERAAFECKSALALLKGEYAPQMLEDFKENGSISKAQYEGQRLEKAKEDYREFFARQAPIPDQSQMVMNTIKVDAEPYTVNPPTFFRQSKDDDRIGTMAILFRGKFYQMKWLRHLCKQEGITMEIVNHKKEEKNT